MTPNESNQQIILSGVIDMQWGAFEKTTAKKSLMGRRQK
jgi:hypothetical protein